MVGIPGLVNEILSICSPAEILLALTQSPDLTQPRPVGSYLEQSAIPPLHLNEDNFLAVGFNPHFPNAAGKGNQPARVHAVFVGNEPVRFTVCCCSIYSQSEFSEDDAPIREDIRILRLDTTQAMRLSRRERNRP